MESQMENTPSPRIYVSCLAAYNAGYLHGCWIDATQDEKNICKEIRQMLTVSPIGNAEEWAIHDHEGFGSIELKEYEDIASVCEKAQFVQDYGEVGLVAYKYSSGNIEEARNLVNYHYQGEWDSKLDFAVYLFEECYFHELPDSYIDYEQFAYDIFIDDYFSVDSQSNKKHIFSNH